MAFLCDWAMPVNTRIWAARTAEGRAGWGQGPRPARPFGAPSRMAFWAVSLPYSLFQSQGQESIFSKITGSRRDSFKTPSNGLRRALAPTRRAGRQTGGGAVGHAALGRTLAREPSLWARCPGAAPPSCTGAARNAAALRRSGPWALQRAPVTSAVVGVGLPRGQGQPPTCGTRLLQPVSAHLFGGCETRLKATATSKDLGGGVRWLHSP